MGWFDNSSGSHVPRLRRGNGGVPCVTERGLQNYGLV